MVSLFDMSTQGARWDHLDTGDSALNQMLDVRMDAIIDLQSVPSNSAVYAILANLMASHLKRTGTKVIVVETVNLFEWEWLKRHPEYQESWFLDRRIPIFRLNSFAKLFAFFSKVPMDEIAAGSLLVLVLNFHELVELYRLQFSAVCEESLVKHQIDKNRTLLNNWNKATEEGWELVKIPSLPRSSALLRESPYSRFRNHFALLLQLMNKFAYQHSSVVLVQGFLTPKYKPYTAKKPLEKSQAGTQAGPENGLKSSSASFLQRPYTSSRLYLTPVTFLLDSDSENRNGSKFSSRILIYNDWYFKSPHFLNEQRDITASDYRFVSVAKVTTYHGQHSFNKPVYLDFQVDPFSSQGQRSGLSWFVGTQSLENSQISETNSLLMPENDLSTLLQSSTQVYGRKRPYVQTDMASSPPITISQYQERFGAGTTAADNENSESDSETASEPESILSDVRSVEIDVGANTIDDSFIEGSDVELTGTIFGEDIDDSF